MPACHIHEPPLRSFSFPPAKESVEVEVEYRVADIIPSPSVMHTDTVQDFLTFINLTIPLGCVQKRSRRCVSWWYFQCSCLFWKMTNFVMKPANREVDFSGCRWSMLLNIKNQKLDFNNAEKKHKTFILKSNTNTSYEWMNPNKQWFFCSKHNYTWPWDISWVDINTQTLTTATTSVVSPAMQSKKSLYHLALLELILLLVPLGVQHHAKGYFGLQTGVVRD